MKKDRSRPFRTSALALLAAAIMTLGIAAGCSPAASTTTAGTDPVTTSAAEGTGADTGAQATDLGNLELTLEELKQYNGKDGQPAYVAVDGIIYDVSEVEAWPAGEHNGNEAGNDLTDVIKDRSPHGVSVLDNLPQVGRIKE